MIIVVVSDTHGNNEFMDVIKERHPNAVMFLHAGDSGLMEIQLEPFETVRGNCDYYIKRSFRMIEINDLKIYMTHGHYLPLDNEYLLSEFAKEKDCNVLIHGHLHFTRHEYYNGVHIICPGSPVYPRGGKPSYAVLEFNSIDDLKVEFIEYGN